jgi:hypothetical protein
MLPCRLYIFISILGGACCPHHQGSPRKVDFPEGVGSKLLWNLSIYVLTDMVSYLRDWSPHDMF